MLTLETIKRWPGKSADEDRPEHPAIYHMLDVAAVAEVLIAPLTIEAAQKRAIVLLVALHDIGKLSTSFRDMLREGIPQTYRHWELSEVQLRTNRDFLMTCLKPDRPNRLPPLFAATAGHHGRPSKLTDTDLARAARQMDATARRDAAQTISGFAKLWPDASLAGLNGKAIKALSWWVSGLVTTADWIGSNTAWFAPVPAQLPVEAYLDQTRNKAVKAVAEAGLSVPELSGASPCDWPELRPMQAACRDIPLSDGPMLALIEDETGAGKTEAALMLAQRMLSAGKGQGLFFALPTMATADAMFARVSRSIGKIFSTPPTLTLAHGRAGLSESFRDIVLGDANAPEDVGCTDWLSDNRRRALLACVGVGTIDQALLSVLPVKFQTLRHYGLSSKILIVDEVHELGEAYIARTLVQLLSMHRAAGGSAILLTATLPLDLREMLLKTYDCVEDGDPSYPALTIANGSQRRDFLQSIGPKGAVRVQRLPDVDAAIDLIAEMANQGAACVWIRNAVDDAIAAVETLRARGLEADLLHARFALGDRKRIEHAARARYGRDGHNRAGGVLVGTQVLESSLDLDFDVMVSDLAPMAGLVQRAGRLWRHMDVRPIADRPVPEPVLYVVAPDPAVVADERWLLGAMDKGAWVYSVDVMWRTALHLFAVGKIVAPSGIRQLIEASYTDDPPLPDVLERAELERLGMAASHGALASQNVVDLNKDYGQGGQAHDDAKYPTRLGPEQMTLVLAKDMGGVLVPFVDGPGGWALSEVPVARCRIDKLDMPDQDNQLIKNVKCDWPDWKQAACILCPVMAGRIADGLQYDVTYGLMLPTH